MTQELIVLTGMSGSGKSVALHALEDAGCYCVDNLPPALLPALMALEHVHPMQRIAVAMDVRSATALPLVPRQLEQLRQQGLLVQSLFLDATTDTLVRRFSETRRRHPLTGDELGEGQRALEQTIERERELLGDLRSHSHVIDTSMLRAAQLQGWVKALLGVPPGQLTLVFQSFAFKRGIPMDADYVFDVRMLPNPYWEPHLRPLTGKDAAVAHFFAQQPEVLRMQQHIGDFVGHWLPALADNHRSYVTVAIGCTGGQHRSVWLAEQLAAQFAGQWTTLLRHRELDFS